MSRIYFDFPKTKMLCLKKKTIKKTKTKTKTYQINEKINNKDIWMNKKINK